MENPVSRARASDSPVSRKVTSPIVRPSVIQGSIHGPPAMGQNSIAENASPSKQQQVPDLHNMYQLSRYVFIEDFFFISFIFYYHCYYSSIFFLLILTASMRDDFRRNMVARDESYFFPIKLLRKLRKCFSL